ncbi:MAG: DUF58 domain-containing protein [Victivallales bacterium]|nr:DUF58 domain-containing protein [Victivallales bacterium]
MLSKELLTQVRKIEIRTRRIVDEITAGAYHSVFKGRGIEFDEVREYTPEDDVRDIDWNVTARMGAPYIKKYVEERELTVMLVVDMSASGKFGSRGKTKLRCATEIAALLAFSAIRNHDRVGLMTFTENVEFYLPPKSGKTHGLRLIRELLIRDADGRGTNIARVLSELMHVLHKRAVIFLISDLIDDSNYSKILTVANKRHDVVVTRILDPTELALPRMANMVVEDAESGRAGDMPGASRGFLQSFARAAEDIHLRNSQLCSRAKVDLVDIRCGEDIVKPLVAFFRQRQSKH